MTNQVATIRPWPITMSALVCAGVSLLLIGLVVQAVAYGAAVEPAFVAALGVAAGGLVCALLLWTLNRFARRGFVVYWLLLVAAAGYSWAFLREARDYRGVLFLVCLVCVGIVLWQALIRSWPRDGARPNTSLERAREG